MSAKTQPIKLKGSSKSKSRAKTKNNFNNTEINNVKQNLDKSIHSQSVYIPRSSMAEEEKQNQVPERYKFSMSSYNVESCNNSILRQSQVPYTIVRIGSTQKIVSSNRNRYSPSKQINMVKSQVQFSQKSPSKYVIHQNPQIKISQQKVLCKPFTKFDSPKVQTLKFQNSLKKNQNHRSSVQVRIIPQNKVTMRPSKVISPSKIVHQTILPVISPKQLQLQRKVRVLEARIHQIHHQKHQMQVILNEKNIRLEYELNFLKQKLNQRIKFDPRPESMKNIKEQQSEQHGTTRRVHPSLENSSIISFVKEAVNQQDQAYTQLRIQYNTLQQKLNEQIKKNKTLQKQNQNLSIKSQALKNQLNSLHLKFTQIQQLKSSIIKEQNNKQTSRKLIQLNNSLKQSCVSYFQNQQLKLQLQNEINQLKQKLEQSLNVNNKLLVQISEIEKENQKLKSLKIQQKQLKQSQIVNIDQSLLKQIQQNNESMKLSIEQLRKKLAQRQEQNQNLKCRIYDLEMNLSNAVNNRNSQCNQSNISLQIQALMTKMQQLQQQINSKATQIQQLNQNLYEKNTLLNQKEELILGLNTKITNLEQKLYNIQAQGRSSTNSSFYKENKSCEKCDQLKKTVFRLNNHLNSKRKSAKNIQLTESVQIKQVSTVNEDL